MSDGAIAAAAALRSDRFRLEREGDWKRLEEIVTRIEKGRKRKLEDDDVLALPSLYRTAASSLSVARENSLDADTIAYLEALTLRAYFLVYGTRTTFGTWISRFFGGVWSRSVRSMMGDHLIALLVMVAGAVVGYLMVASDPDWFYALVDPAMAGGRVPGATREALLESLGGAGEGDNLSIFAASLFSNNSQVCIMAFALGFAFGIPTVLLLIHNLALLGAMVWVFEQRGLAVDFLAWLSIHGTTELLAILIAGGAGIHIGRAVAFPGQRTVIAAASDAGRRAAIVMLGVILMLLVAGLLEGYARQLVTATPSRFAIGGFMLLFWLAYFGLAGRQARR